MRHGRQGISCQAAAPTLVADGPKKHNRGPADDLSFHASLAQPKNSAIRFAKQPAHQVQWQHVIDNQGSDQGFSIDNSQMGCSSSKNMSVSVQKNATRVLRALYENQGDINAQDLSALTGLSPGEVNDAVTILEQDGNVKALKWLGTAPYIFGQAAITARGKVAWEGEAVKTASADVSAISSSPIPVGSPYGFTDKDWEYLKEEKSKSNVLKAVLGYQFKSAHYVPDELIGNLKAMFQTSVNA